MWADGTATPSKIANSKLLNEPMIKAMILGALAGVVCRLLPEELSSFFLNDIASPIMSTVMGPVFSRADMTGPFYPENPNGLLYS